MLDILKNNRSIISGSSPLPALTALRFRPNDLDVYVPEERQEPMVRAMEHEFGFHHIRSQESHYDRNNSIVRVLWMARGTHILNLVIVKGDNAAIAPFLFHSTVVMNIVTPYGILCAYPDLTLQGYAIPNVNCLVDTTSRVRSLRCYRKYTERGVLYSYDLRALPGWEDHTCGSDKSCPATVRSLHDDGTLFVPFPSRPSAGEVNDVIGLGRHTVVWSLGGKSCTIDGAYTDSFVLSVPLHHEL
ncbi:hypothetical protein C8R46DRAFT_895624 [Mycena filopes]|nr:hypothetical protein C8R46DRAFT_895624 [Mycena filopes]